MVARPLCTRCQRRLRSDERIASGLCFICDPKPRYRREYNSQWRKNNAAHVLNNNRKWRSEHRDQERATNRLYNRTINGVLNPTDEIKIGPCEICAKEAKLQLDHDHSTGLIRGWLCVQCNTKLDWALKHIKEIGAYRQKTCLT